ncbi:3'-5' exonuclease, partial [Heyndrickxia sporothermodurans]
MDVLASPSAWPVRDGDSLRDVRPGDIAVLCRTNKDVEKLATALASFGVPVAVERGDLFKAEEVELVMAALRWTASRRDRLALTELARIIGGTTAPDAWLEALSSEDPDAALIALVPFATELNALRERQLELTPCEMVDAVLLGTGVIDLVCRWGDAAERLLRLEAFRGVACSYERECTQLRAPATLTGLVAWLNAQSKPQPKSLHGNAVHVTTYHKAKGLEWPVVILAQLESDPKASLFKPAVEVDGAVDWADPLAGRWIRLWVWPYGARNVTRVNLDASAPNSPIGQRALKRAKEEAVRVLYVGATRARDYLVLNKSTARRPAWLEELDTGAEQHIVLPAEDGTMLRVGT